MKKIPTLFVRDFLTRSTAMARDEVTPGCEWVMAGHGTPYQKMDGTACLMKRGVLYKRYDAKKGKTPPPNFTPAQEPDTETGHWPGWVPVGEGPEDQYHREALHNMRAIGQKLEDGTYELIGPKIQGNREHVHAHMLISHDSERLFNLPRPLTYEGLRHYFAEMETDIEGVVWHGWVGGEVVMCKLKRSDFNLGERVPMKR